MTHSNGTPKDLKQAIRNALAEIEKLAEGTGRTPFCEADVVMLEAHVRDFMAQRFSVAMYHASKLNEEFEGVVQDLFNNVFPKPERKPKS